MRHQSPHPDAPLADITAFVTGASQGLGRAIAIELAAQGATVALAARGDGIHETADIIDDEERTLAVQTDVTDEASVREAIETTVDTFGGLDCLVNNAGIAGPTAPIEEVTEAEWERTMDVNVTGVFRCVKHASPHLRESDQGSIITIGSIGGKRPFEARTPYSASKSALIGLTRSLAFEFGDDDVTVNTVCPGATRGPRIDDVIQKQADQRGIDFETAKTELFTDDTALGRLTEPEDIAEQVAFLAGDGARNITAQDLNVDAGAVWY